MSNMLKRALSGAVYVALVVICILCGAEWFMGLMMLFTVLAMIELQGVLDKSSHLGLSIRVFDIVAGLVFVAVLGFAVSQTVSGYLLFSGIILMLLYFPFRMIFACFDLSEHPARNALYSLLCQVYIAWPLGLLLMAYIVGGYEIVLATFIFIWLNDTGAYLCGITFGRHRLCERLSPKKSWEGFWGGFILSVIAGGVTALILRADESCIYVIWMGFAALVSIFSTFGDLFESLIKRTLGIKDSGTMIPGHGGILDRLDSLLAVAPVAFVFALLMEKV